MSQEPKPAPALLLKAARIVDEALNQLNVTFAPCGHCKTRLWEDLNQARVWESLSQVPERLRNAADKLAETPKGSSPGYASARRQFLERGEAGRTFESDALDLLAEVAAGGGTSDDDVRERARGLLREAGVLQPRA